MAHDILADYPLAPEALKDAYRRALASEERISLAYQLHPWQNGPRDIRYCTERTMTALARVVMADARRRTA